jgi:hypothetical protein
MGKAKLNVWFTESDSPCKVSDATHYVSVFTCDGKILKWAGKEYFLLEAQYGHLEVDLPPGCYYLLGASIHCENAYTDAAVVQVGCGETACVTLWLGTLRRCLERLNAALRLPRTAELIPPQLLSQARDILPRITERLPRPIHEFELAYMEETEKVILKSERPQQKAQ